LGGEDEIFVVQARFACRYHLPSPLSFGYRCRLSPHRFNGTRKNLSVAGASGGARQSLDAVPAFAAGTHFARRLIPAWSSMDGEHPPETPALPRLAPRHPRGGPADRRLLRRAQRNWNEEEMRWFETLLEEQDVDIMAWAIGASAPPPAWEGRDDETACAK
jgi:hypothetical protein